MELADLLFTEINWEAPEPIARSGATKKKAGRKGGAGKTAPSGFCAPR